MGERQRQITVIMVAVLFATLATQAALFAHLLCEEHHQGHHSQKCETCRQLMLSTQNLMVEQQSTISRTPAYQRCPAIHVEITSSISTHQISNPRAPPAVS